MNDISKSPSQNSEARAYVEPELSGLRVLLVDDNRANRLIGKKFLERKDVILQEASSGPIALELLENEEFDVILMDIQMPQMDGWEATQIIRANPRTKDLPVIAMTGNTSTADQARSIEVGMNGHLSKPIVFKELYATLYEWMPQSSVPVPRSDVHSDAISLEGVDNLEVEDPEFYQELLSSFTERYSEIRHVLRDLLAQNKIQEVKSRLHSMKGVAGNLRATALYESIIRFESDLKTGRDYSVAQQDFGVAFSDLAQKVAIAKGRGVGGKDSALQKKEDIKTRELILRLQNEMGEDVGAALDLLKILGHLLEGSAHEMAFTSVANALMKFDTDAAHAELGAMLSDLEDGAGQ
ncbi:response regulator [Myxococcota bacterium]|nr:response regulator [Myxococcota bacterium]